jgi:hypothetical protein
VSHVAGKGALTGYPGSEGPLELSRLVGVHAPGVQVE